MRFTIQGPLFMKLLASILTIILSHFISACSASGWFVHIRQGSSKISSIEHLRCPGLWKDNAERKPQHELFQTALQISRDRWLHSDSWDRFVWHDAGNAMVERQLSNVWHGWARRVSAIACLFSWTPTQRVPSCGQSLQWPTWRSSQALAELNQLLSQPSKTEMPTGCHGCKSCRSGSLWTKLWWVENKSEGSHFVTQVSRRIQWTVQLHRRSHCDGLSPDKQCWGKTSEDRPRVSPGEDTYREFDFKVAQSWFN